MANRSASPSLVRARQRGNRAPSHARAAASRAQRARPPRSGPSRGLRGQATTQPAVHFYAAAPVRTSQSLSIRSKYARISASTIQLTFGRYIPKAKASSASCAPRPGRNPWLNPRNSGSNIGERMVSATAFWTILSSSAAMPSGRVPPSGFGISTRRDGSARYAPYEHGYADRAAARSDHPRIHATLRRPRCVLDLWFQKKWRPRTDPDVRVNASGSYLGYLTANRAPGHGCRIRGFGQ